MDLLDELSARWPGVELGSLRAEGRQSPEILHDLALTRACAQLIPSALAELDSILGEEVARVVRPLNAALVDDVMQLVRERLLAPGKFRIAEYRGEGALRGWLRAIAVRTALNAQRGERSADQLDDNAEVLLAEADPELELFRARYRESFRSAFAASVAALSARERTVLKLHAIDGLPLSKIGAIYRKDTSTVSRWMEQIRRTLRDGTLAGLISKLALSPEELQSVQRAAGFEVSVSLARLLQE